MTPSGLSAASRRELSRLLRDNPPLVTTSLAASTLGLTPTAASRRLAAWSRSGWLARVRRGAYVPVPVESPTADVALEDPRSVAMVMFAPCYIGGWSAAEHWGMTEQIFRSVCVMTLKRPYNRQPLLRKVRFDLHTVAQSQLIGLKTVWRGGTRVQVSDPARTLVEMLTSPGLGGGIRHVAEMLTTLLHDQPEEAPKLLQYAEKLAVGAVYKRLGYLLQRDHIDSVELIDACRQRMTAGYASLDPALPADRLVTAWRVWVPDSELRESARAGCSRAVPV